MQCYKCGDKNLNHLSVDHIDGGGHKQKRKIKGSIYIWLKKEEFPIGYQILCMNCQTIKKRKNNEQNKTLPPS